MTDVFKKVYTKLRPSSSELILESKNKAEELLAIMDRGTVEGVAPNMPASPSGRELALAKTNLEQAIMWYTKAVVITDETVQEFINR